MTTMPSRPFCLIALLPVAAAWLLHLPPANGRPAAATTGVQVGWTRDHLAYDFSAKRLGTPALKFDLELPDDDEDEDKADEDNSALAEDEYEINISQTPAVNMTVEQLRTQLKMVGQKSSGTKKELVERVQMLQRRHALNLPVHDLQVQNQEEFRWYMLQTANGFERAVERAQEYIRAGDAFQVVLSRRQDRETHADPFDLYRALRVVNPSPYQIYLQAEGCILVASSPEILCRVRDRTVVNRPLAGTRRRGRSESEDQALEAELLADEKERAEHVMLVDLGRNDVGRVAEQGSVKVERCMEVERYSHVMHISSTVTGELRPGLDCWDALRATLPVGTVSGAPKVRAIQIIDELEPVRRGPYSGGIGAVGWNGDMDIALALRTMVIPTANHHAGQPWIVGLQAGAGVVLDSVPSAEFEETIAKSAALGRAVDLAERAFGA